MAATRRPLAQRLLALLAHLQRMARPQEPRAMPARNPHPARRAAAAPPRPRLGEPGCPGRLAAPPAQQRPRGAQARAWTPRASWLAGIVAGAGEQAAVTLEVARAIAEPASFAAAYHSRTSDSPQSRPGISTNTGPAPAPRPRRRAPGRREIAQARDRDRPLDVLAPAPAGRCPQRSGRAAGSRGALSRTSGDHLGVLDRRRCWSRQAGGHHCHARTPVRRPRIGAKARLCRVPT
jgi:hypothetical protein